MNPKPKPPQGQKHPYAVLAAMVRALVQRPQTARSLARAARVGETSARRLLKAFHEAGTIHVCAYARARGNRLGGRLYAFGEGQDIPRPRRLSNAEYMRRYRQRKKTLGGAWRGVKP